MVIGVMSDSHGRADRVHDACALFDELGVEHLIHCGDVGGTDVLDELVGRACNFVWGNMDFPDHAIRAYLHSVGLPWPERSPVSLVLDGKRLLIFHGHEPGVMERAPTLDADYAFHGHTHQCRDERFGRLRVINPGALARAARHTVATLNLSTDVLTFHEIPSTG